MRSRLLVHAPLFIAIWLILFGLSRFMDPLWNSYLALGAMYATAMLGMVILVGLSGQVSLGNGALMAVGAYAFAVSSLNWSTVPFTSIPWNAVWSMVFAGLMGVLVGLIVGWIGARLRGPYLAGLTLGLAVGIPAIASRFTGVLGGNQGLLLTVPYPEGGYSQAAVESGAEADAEAALDAAIASAGPTAAPEASVDSSDMLSVDDVTGGASPMASSDMLSVDDVTGGASPMASSDMLSVDDVTGGASIAPVGPTLDPTPMASTSSAAEPVAQASGFVLEQWQASVALTVACIAGFIALNLVRGRQGGVWRAVRDDPIAASVVGINPAGAKISAFVVSSLFAALSGAVFAQILAYVGPSVFGIGLSLSLLVGVVLGGRSSLVGAAIGALIIVLLPVAIDSVSEDRGWPQQVGANLPTLLYGLLVVLVVLVAPGGVAGLWQRRRH